MALESIYNANYTGQQWKEEMNRLGLSTPDEVEETPYQFILQYDIKDSSGKEDPENKNKSPIVKGYINRELQKTKENIKEQSFYYMLWGWLTTIAAILQYLINRKALKDIFQL